MVCPLYLVDFQKHVNILLMKYDVTIKIFKISPHVSYLISHSMKTSPCKSDCRHSILVYYYCNTNPLEYLVVSPLSPSEQRQYSLVEWPMWVQRHDLRVFGANQIRKYIIKKYLTLCLKKLLHYKVIPYFVTRQTFAVLISIVVFTTLTCL